MLRNNYKIIYVYNIQYIFPVQILFTNKSIIRHKISIQINLHFQTWTYIFRHTHPYSYIDKLLQQFFTAIFSSRHVHFSTSIKCIQYTLLLIENYSQVIFYNLRQSSTEAYSIRHAHCIHDCISPKDVSWCRSLEDCVELSESSFPFHTNIIPLNQKSKQESFDKFWQNLHHYYSTLQLECQEKS